MREHIKIPHERVAVLIGPKGSMKGLIEDKATARLNIDSQNGTVEIIEPEDPIKGLRAKEVIHAIARGFSPEKALRLFDNDSLLYDTIDLSNIARTEKDLKRIKGRIIGRAGKTRSIFETLTNVNISVYGKTISMIGYPEQIAVARAGIDLLLKGSTHGPVYKFLEKKRNELRLSKLGF